jgi:transcription antitermination factor NusG
MQSNEYPWFAVRVRGRFERTAEASLEGRGFKCLLPSYTVTSKWSDRSKTLVKPLFPGYLFCQFDFDRRLPILTSPGVMGIVSTGSLPTPVQPDEIRALQTVMSSGRNARRHPFLCSGARVRLNGGPLKGCEGFLVETKSDRRLILNVKLLQRAVAVEVDEADVEVMESARRSVAWEGIGRVA